MARGGGCVDDRHHVVIIGGGFGGLSTALALRGAPVRITLVDRRNFHLFQPLLYQVATGGLSPANIAAPIRNVLKQRREVQVLLAEVAAIEPTRRRVLLGDGDLAYDTLVVAAGVRHDYFGNDRWERLAPGLKSLEDATAIRRRVLGAFEAAERAADRALAAEWLTFVIVGGGATGVELAGTLAEIARDTLRRDFRNIDPGAARIIIAEGAERILGSFRPELSRQAERSLAELGVSVRTRSLVTDIRPDIVVLRSGERLESISARTVLWAAGVRASPLGESLRVNAGARLDRQGRVEVTRDLSLPGHPEVYVIGDLALVRDAAGRPLPGVAPVAIQAGRHVSRAIRARLAGDSTPAFEYHDQGSMAAIGRARAVVDLGWIHFGGYAAWLAWLFIHLIQLVDFQNRILVLCQWAWNYFTFSRSARLITDPVREP